MSEERKYSQGETVYLKLHHTDARVLSANHCGYIPVKILHVQQSNCMVEEVEDVPFRKTYRVEHELLITPAEFKDVLQTKLEKILTDPDKKVPITELADSPRLEHRHAAEVEIGRDSGGTIYALCEKGDYWNARAGSRLKVREEAEINRFLKAGTEVIVESVHPNPAKGWPSYIELEGIPGKFIFHTMHFEIIDPEPTEEWIDKHSVECPACSAAGGADRGVRHLPPVCPTKQKGSYSPDGYYPHPSAVSGLPREPVTHRLKAAPETMRLLRQGEITSNIRKYDRDYRKGDKIIFNEYIASPTCIENKGQWTSATFTATITHVQGDTCAGLETGFCVLSLAFKLGECLGHDFEIGGKYDPR